MLAVRGGYAVEAALQAGARSGAALLPNLGSAIAAFDREEMPAHGADMRARLAHLRGRAADPFLPAERFASRRASSAMLAPWFPE